MCLDITNFILKGGWRDSKGWVDGVIGRRRVGRKKLMFGVVPKTPRPKIFFKRKKIEKLNLKTFFAKNQEFLKKKFKNFRKKIKNVSNKFSKIPRKKF